MTEDPNVNLDGNVCTEVNVKRLGRQQKRILRWLYEHRDGAHKQVEIIDSLYGDVTDTRQASVSRTVSNLEEKGLVTRRKKVLITPEDDPRVTDPYYSRHRVRFHITKIGETFVERDDRFPQILAGDS